MTAPYRTGNASINTQATAVTFSTDVTLDSTFTGRKIFYNTNDNVYDFTFSNTTGGTINPPLSGDVNVVNGAFTVYQPIYALAPDFARFVKNGGILLYQGGEATIIREAQSNKDWYENYSRSPSTPKLCRLVEFGTAGVQHVELTPAPQKAIVLPYDYIRELDPLRETTSGFVDISSGSTAVTGSAGTTRFTEAQTGWFFRIDAFGIGEDSEWYRINQITHNSSLVLSTAFGLSGATTARYTICAAPQMPTLLHGGILAGATMRLMTDQNDPQYAVMASMKAATIIEARKLYKNRVASQELDMITEEFHYRR